jgi:hypothetical protein
MADAMTPDQLIEALGRSGLDDDEYLRAVETVRELDSTAEAGVALGRAVLAKIDYQPTTVVMALHRLEARLAAA